MKLKIKNLKLKYRNGFTLIELIIAMSIFVILMSIAAGGFINSLRNQRTAAALMATNDNMTMIIEQMAREIRTGYNFGKISNQEFQFVNAYNQTVRYRLNNNAIEKGTQTGVIAALTFNKITADNVEIGNFNVEICGKNFDSGNNPLDFCSGGNPSPPRIILSFSITSSEPDVKKLKIFTNIQTTISSRVIIPE